MFLNINSFGLHLQRSFFYFHASELCTLILLSIQGGIHEHRPTRFESGLDRIVHWSQIKGLIAYYFEETNCTVADSFYKEDVSCLVTDFFDRGCIRLDFKLYRTLCHVRVRANAGRKCTEMYRNVQKCTEMYRKCKFCTKSRSLYGNISKYTTGLVWFTWQT